MIGSLTACPGLVVPPAAQPQVAIVRQASATVRQATPPRFVDDRGDIFPTTDIIAGKLDKYADILNSKMNMDDLFGDDSSSSKRGGGKRKKKKGKKRNKQQRNQRKGGAGQSNEGRNDGHGVQLRVRRPGAHCR